jgi:molybdopterin molybdotransferase
MLTVEEARRIVLEHARPLGDLAQTVPLNAENRVLGEEVRADLDSPPFDKSLVDGYAVRSADLAEPGPTPLAIVDEITAGRTPSRALGPGLCARIMTGAPLPEGADAVVMHERTELLGDGRVAVPGPVAPGENRLLRGAEMRAGEVVLRPGRRLGAPEHGVLASVGRLTIRVRTAPELLVVTTGDELVEVGETPGPGQIRNSNAWLLRALLRDAGHPRVRSATVGDDLDALRRVFGGAVEPDANVDVLAVSGGVSEGTLDLVPRALEEVGVRQVFHKVRLKPGKPLWFGVGPERGDRPPVLVFGLPGNPVSGLVGSLLFVIPALNVLAGLERPGPCTLRLPLAGTYRHRGERATYHPARLVVRDGLTAVEPLPWAGSPDLLAVSRSDGFAAFPPGDRSYEGGEALDFLPLRPDWD